MDTMKKKLYPTYLTFPAVFIFGIFFALPIISGFIMSFTDWNTTRLLNPKFNGFENFTHLFADEYFLLALKNTLKFGIITTFFIVILSLGLSLLLNNMVFFKNFYRTVFYLPAVLSLIVVGIMFTSILKFDQGILNKILIYLGLSNFTKDWLADPKSAFNFIIIMQVWKWTGFSMAIFLAGLQGISREYMEAAKIDGAGAFSRFKNITFPLLAPAFTVVVTMNTIGGFKVFEQVYVLTGGGPGNSTQVLSTYIYKEFSKGLLGRSSAMGLILFVLVSFVGIFINKSLKKREVHLS